MYLVLLTPFSEKGNPYCNQPQPISLESVKNLSMHNTYYVAWSPKNPNIHTTLSEKIAQSTFADIQLR